MTIAQTAPKASNGRRGKLRPYVQAAIDEQRSRLGCGHLEEARISKKFAEFTALQSATECEMNDLLYGQLYAPAGMWPHLQRICLKEFQDGLAPAPKSPPLMRELAAKIGFTSMNFDSRAKSPFYNGFKTIGWMEPQHDLFPNGRPLSSKEAQQANLFDPVLLESFNDLHAKPPKVFTDEATTEWGWRHWSKNLCDGVRLTPVDNPVGVVSYCFYSPTKWDEHVKAYRKIRCICNEKAVNNLFSPTSYHLSLPSHSELADTIAYCINPGFDEHWLGAKEEVTGSIQKELALRKSRHGGKKGKKTYRPAWNEFNAFITPASEASFQSFLPLIGKIDLSNAYYQLGVRDPRLCPVGLFDGKGWNYFLSNCLTFGNRHSVNSFQTFSEFVARLAAFLGIAVVPYLDDFVLISAPEFQKVHHKFLKKLIGMLGFSISSKADGDICGAQNIITEVLGLDYLTDETGVQVTIPDSKAEAISREATELADQADGPLALDTKLLKHVFGLLNFIACSRLWRDEAPLLSLTARFLENPPVPGSVDRALFAYYLRQLAKSIRDCKLCYRLSLELTKRKRAYLMSDASRTRTNFGLAWVLKSQSGTTFCELRGARKTLPPCLQHASIYELELFAVLMAVEQADVSDLLLAVKVDNVAACFSLRKGTVRTTLAAAICSRIFCVLKSKRTKSNISYLSSERNPADAPSRIGQLTDLGESGTKIVPDHQPLFSALEELCAGLNYNGKESGPQASWARKRPAPAPNETEPKRACNAEIRSGELRDCNPVPKRPRNHHPGTALNGQWKAGLPPGIYPRPFVDWDKKLAVGAVHRMARSPTAGGHPRRDCSTTKTKPACSP